VQRSVAEAAVALVVQQHVGPDPRDAVEDVEQHADALALQGTLFHQEGLLARAESTLARALASDPGHTIARTQMRAVRAARARLTNVNAEPKPEKTRLLARLLAWRP